MDDQEGMAENRRRPLRHVAGMKEGKGRLVDVFDLAGDPNGKVPAQGKAGQGPDATFAPESPLPGRFQIRPQG
ncbi:MAG: hypothetical protein A4E72_01249 [Syntrophus sp. PtaU1.Bin208]|nr:MAG: hypothetical protein A4E72_01249 [Syntrophus sp. PtaU1.Bin208]